MFFMLWVVAFPSDVNVKADLKALEAYNEGIRMLFTENVGQLSDEVVFYSMHPSVVYVLRDGSIHINGVRVSFGAKPRFITGDMPLITKISYFGRNKAISDMPTYRRVVLKEIYPKIDAILTADGRGVVEFQFVVYPGGDPSRIKVETDGRVVQREGGIYIVKEGKELVRISDLKAYQGAEEINVKAEVKGKGVMFIVKSWDRKHTLLIDPVATAILASTDRDLAHAVAVDSSGNVFVSGYTANYVEFAPSRNVFGTAPDSLDAFVSKLSNDLSQHLATAILASDAGDVANDLAIDRFGNVFVVGITENSSNFAPNRSVFGTSGGLDAFVSKLNNDLSQHLATAILTSSNWDHGYAIALDSAGNVFVAGRTYDGLNFSDSRHVFGNPGSVDVYVSKLSGDLTQHIATAILASNDWDEGHAVAVDDSGNVFVAGLTVSSLTFVSSKFVFGTPGGFTDAFVSKLSNDLDALKSTAILTSSGADYAFSLYVDDSGNVFVAGRTESSSDFAPSRAIFGTVGGSYDVFVSKLNNDLDIHRATAILASSDEDRGVSVMMDRSGKVLVVGSTTAYANFAPSRVVFGTTGIADAFVSKLSRDLSQHLGTAILASGDDDYASDVAVDNSGVVFVAGKTRRHYEFSVNRNVFGTTDFSSEYDAFVVRLENAFTNVYERPNRGRVADVKVSNGSMVFSVPTSAYVGFDVYSADGRLIRRVSLGYLPAGRYEYRLKLPKGAYLLKVRIGDEVREIKGVF